MSDRLFARIVLGRTRRLSRYARSWPCAHATLLATILIGTPSFAAIHLSNTQSHPLQSVDWFRVTPDGSATLFAATLQDESQRLFISPNAAAGTQTYIGHDPTVADAFYDGNLKFSPDGTHAVYGANNTGSVYAIHSLYAVDLQSTTNVVHVSNLTGAQGAYRSHWDFAPDNNTLVFTGVSIATGGLQIMSAPIDGSAPAQQLTTLPGGSTTNVNDFYLTPDRQRVLFTSTSVNPASGAYDLFSVPTDASDNQLMVNDMAASDEDVAGVTLMPDSEHVLYRVVSGYPRTNLYFAAIDRTNSQQQVARYPADLSIDGWTVSPDGNNIILKAHFGTSTSTWQPAYLFSVSPHNLYTAVPITPEPARGVLGAIQDYRFTPDSARIIYTGFMTGYEQVDLYAASTTVANTTLQLNTNENPTGRVVRYELTSEAQTVVYAGDILVDNQHDLFSASTTAPGTQVRLSGQMQPQSRVSSIHITPDDTRVVFNKQAPGSPVYEPYVATLGVEDSDNPLMRLEAGQTFGTYGLTPDGQFALFATSAAFGSLERDALFAVPLNGGTPIRLHDVLPDYGELDDVTYEPAIGTVVFKASRQVDVTLISCTGGPGGVGQPHPGCVPRITTEHAYELLLANMPAAAGSLADLNADGLLDDADVDAFALGIVDPAAYAYAYGLSVMNYAALNGDDAFNTDDVDAFALMHGISVLTVIDRIAQTPIPGDLNADGIVGIADLNVILSYWNQTVTPGGLDQGDPTADGFVGIADLNYLLANWNAGLTPPPSAVPEPATLTLLLTPLLASSRRPIPRPLAA